MFLSQPLDLSSFRRGHAHKAFGDDPVLKAIWRAELVKTHGPYVHSETSDPGSDDRTGSKKRELPDVALEKLHALEKAEEGVYKQTWRRYY